MGDFNINWENKTCRKKLKEITDDFNLTQKIQGPTRVTQSSHTQIDLVFTNRPDWITKSSNLLTGISDHNVTLVVRKLTKNTFKNHINVQQYTKILKSEQSHYDAAVNQIDWSGL